MGRRIGLMGDEAVAYAVKQCDVGLVSAYPITPQTIMVERISEYVANGEIDTEFVCVESEHSALSVCVGASLSGLRVFTATASQGLALMHEVLYAASGLRCPIVMAVANRALSAPLNIHCDHSDMMGSRDCGWVQVFAENVQEAYDWVIQAFKIAEHPDVQLPTVVNLDGFTLTHCMEDVEVLEDEDVKKFLPPRKPIYWVDPKQPMTFGAWAMPNYYYKFKLQQQEAIMRSLRVVKEVGEEFGKLTGRRYDTLYGYGLEDAEVAVLSMGSTSGTIRYTARRLRESDGLKVGALKLWLFRPFPEEDLVSALEKVKVLIVLDRALSPGAVFGPLGSDIASLMVKHGLDFKLLNYTYGLGGDEVTPEMAEKLFKLGLKVAEGAKPPSLTGYVREVV
ncbi:MAG: 2-ketoisovalerate ferredoxin oxidoreductase subunit alpha [Candidatus Bathyarchaeota archaeon B24]|nr:MAG: 2-ketoisovalerate ferredoxin oxidoreductase subunit alpha [Candidatus Bathyarchaeota archaeon B24]RLI24980.1 MAG: pyruvate ferredoxin oxidoreductase [Candidatus Bathyarchaeota archaeon]